MSQFRDEDFKTMSMCDPQGTGEKCVAVALTPEAVGVRDTKDPTKMTLVFTHSEWAAFLDGIKKGEFDL